MNRHFQSVRIGLVALGVVQLSGCAGTAVPNFSNPGPAGYQRRNALQYDPYPLDDVAPAVAGGRPREYARPMPEVQRGQAFAPRPETMQPMTWPLLNVPTLAPPPAASAPYPYAPPVPSAPSYQVRPPY